MFYLLIGCIGTASIPIDDHPNPSVDTGDFIVDTSDDEEVGEDTGAALDTAEGEETGMDDVDTSTDDTSTDTSEPPTLVQVTIHGATIPETYVDPEGDDTGPDTWVTVNQYATSMRIDDWTPTFAWSVQVAYPLTVTLWEGNQDGSNGAALYSWTINEGDPVPSSVVSMTLIEVSP